MPDGADAPEAVLPAPPDAPVERRRRRDLLRRLGPAGIVAAVVAVMPPAGAILLLGTIRNLSPWLRSLGGAGPVVVASSFALLCGLCVLPTYVVSIVCGWALGFPTGWFTALVALTGACVIGYGVSLAAVGDRLAKASEHNPRADAVRRALVGSGFWRTTWIVALVRVSPVPPFGVTNLMLASARCPVAPFTLGTTLGLVPQTLAVVPMAARLEQLEFRQQPWMFLSGIAAMVLVFTVIGYVGKKALARATEGRSTRTEDRR